MEKNLCKKTKYFGVENIKNSKIKNFGVKKQNFWCKKIGVKNGVKKLV